MTTPKHNLKINQQILKWMCDSPTLQNTLVSTYGHPENEVKSTKKCRAKIKQSTVLILNGYYLCFFFKVHIELQFLGKL